MRNAAGVPQGTDIYSNLPHGGGGYVIGLDATAEAILSWTDVGGAYYLDLSVTPWENRPIVTGTSMPSGHVGPGNTGQSGLKSEFLGVYAGAIAPSNPDRIIFGFDGYLFGSDDKGVTNILISLAQQKMQTNSGASRLNNRKAQFHPTDPNTWIFGMNDAVFYSTTGFTGAPTQVSGLAAISVPAGDDSYGHYVGIDTTGKAYIAVRGTGVYALASVSSTPVLTSGGPTLVCYMDMDITTNKLWCCDEAGVIWIYNGSAWSHPAAMPAEMADNIAAKVTAMGSNVALFNANGIAAYSSDGGTTWSGWFVASIRYSAKNTIPYLDSGASGAQIFPGGIKFRPGQTKELWVSHGTGLCYTIPAPPALLTLQDATPGIEEFVANQALWTTGGRIVTTFWDKGFSDRTEATIDRPMTRLRPGGFIAGWGVDGDDSLIAVLCSWDGSRRISYSQSGGDWTDLPNNGGTAGKGGCIAVNGTEIIVVPSNDSSLPLLWTSLSATPITLNFSGGRTSGDMGWGHAYYNNRQIVAADRTVPGDFYLYCCPTNDNVGRGFYKRSAGQTSLTFISYGPAWIQGQFRVRFKPVPGHTAHLFATPGSGLANNEQFYRTEDGCANWIAVPNVTNVTDFSFTTTLPGNDYPSIEFEGSVSGGSPALYVCDNIRDASPTYRLRSSTPGNSADSITCLTCSPREYGRRIIGHSGTGYNKGKLDHVLTAS